MSADHTGPGSALTLDDDLDSPASWRTYDPQAHRGDVASTLRDPLDLRGEDTDETPNSTSHTALPSVTPGDVPAGPDTRPSAPPADDDDDVPVTTRSAPPPPTDTEPGAFGSTGDTEHDELAPTDVAARAPAIPAAPRLPATPVASAPRPATPSRDSDRRVSPSASLGAHPAASTRDDRAERRVEQLAEQLAAARHDLSVARGELEQLATTLRAAKREVDDANRDIGELRRRARSAEQQRDAQRSTAEKAGRALARIDEERHKSEGKHDSLRALIALRADRIRELEGQLKERDTRLSALDRDLKALRTTQQQPGDDLQLIFGIGPVFCRKLREMGYLHFRDIAAWSDDDVRDVARRLKVHPARIFNNDWRGSAAAQQLEAEVDAM